jgi:hypothetical protein
VSQRTPRLRIDWNRPPDSNSGARQQGPQWLALVSASLVKKLLPTAPRLMYHHSRSGV